MAGACAFACAWGLMVTVSCGNVCGEGVTGLAAGGDAIGAAAAVGELEIGLTIREFLRSTPYRRFAAGGEPAKPLAP